MEEVSEAGVDEGAAMPLVELDSDDDPESTLRIGRWGEEFVSAVLGRRIIIIIDNNIII